MKKLWNWLSEAIPRWWVIVLLLMVAILVEYDNNPKVLESRGAVYERTPRLPPVEKVDAELDSLSQVYADAWSDWWRMDRKLAKKIILAADAEMVPHHVAFGVVAVESGFDSLAVSRAGAVGLTQIKPSTARIYVRDISVKSLKSATLNLRLGFRYFHDLLHRYDGDVMLALAAYNMGPTRLDELEGNVSMEYPNKVLGR